MYDIMMMRAAPSLFKMRSSRPALNTTFIHKNIYPFEVIKRRLLNIFFFKCYHARAVWFGTLELIHQGVYRTSDLIFGLYKKGDPERLKKGIITLNFLWWKRNQAVHMGIDNSPEKTIEEYLGWLLLETSIKPCQDETHRLMVRNVNTLSSPSVWSIFRQGWTIWIKIRKFWRSISWTCNLRFQGSHIASFPTSQNPTQNVSKDPLASIRAALCWIKNYMVSRYPIIAPIGFVGFRRKPAFLRQALMESQRSGMLMQDI